jgi:ribosomal-protein-alanine N-acetyltransferase
MRLDDVPHVTEIADDLDHAPPWSSAVYRRALDPDASPPRITLVAEDQTGVIGFLVAVLLPPQAELEIIAVRRPAQRQGVARSLLAVLMARLSEHRITDLLLEVRESNRPARRLYRSLGFRETGRRPAYYFDPQEDAILLDRTVENTT